MVFPLHEFLHNAWVCCPQPNSAWMLPCWAFRLNYLGRQEEHRVPFLIEWSGNILLIRSGLREIWSCWESGSYGYLEKHIPGRGNNVRKCPEAQRCPISKQQGGHHHWRTVNKGENSEWGQRDVSGPDSVRPCRPFTVFAFL